METIFQSIEILSKEKGIDPQIVLDAVKDAMLIAARKHYRTNEDYVADMDPKTGAIKLYAVKKAVEAVEDPAHEMTLARGAADRFQGGDRRRGPHPEEHRRAGAYFRADRQAGDLPEGPRSGARNGIPGVLGAHRRTGELHHQARGRSGLHAGSGQDRSQAAEEGAVASGRLQRGRPRALRDQAGGQVEQGPGRAGIARGAGTGDAPVRTGSAGDLRRHGGDQGLRARGRRADQDRGAEPRPRRGQRGRLRGHEGHARAIHHPRAARREDRHYRIFRRLGGVCDACA